MKGTFHAARTVKVNQMERMVVAVVLMTETSMEITFRKAVDSNLYKLICFGPVPVDRREYLEDENFLFVLWYLSRFQAEAYLFRYRAHMLLHSKKSSNRDIGL